MRIVVVHNGNHSGVIGRLGRPSPEKYSLRHVQMVVDALRRYGHEVHLVEGDIELFGNLRRLLPPNPEDGTPGGMVFNMAYGIQGDARYTHIPAMLELAGIPYTGSSPLGHSLALDKVITKILMSEAGVPTPNYRVLAHPEDSIDGLRFPLVVKPRHESTSYGLRLVQQPLELRDAVRNIVETYQQTALVEEYIDGREVCIGILGNETPLFLPPVELDFGDRDLKLMTWDDKFHKRLDEPRKVCPAPLAEDFLAELNAISLATFRACHLHDYARVDIRIDAAGRPFVLEINSMASLGDGGSYVAAAQAAGIDYAQLIQRIVEVTTERYRHVRAPSLATTASSASAAA